MIRPAVLAIDLLTRSPRIEDFVFGEGDAWFIGSIALIRIFWLFNVVSNNRMITASFFYDFFWVII